MKIKVKKTQQLLLIFSIILLIKCHARGQSYESVDLKVSNNITLDARYYSSGQEGPAVLMLCQCDPTTDQDEYNSLAIKLQNKGYHVLTFDYRGYGKSGGAKPDMGTMETMDDVMSYWRKNWMGDVDRAFKLLSSKEGVQKNRMTLVGASCGNFLALEYTLNNSNLNTLTLLGGPVDDILIEKLAGNTALPILIMGGNEGPTFKWVDRIFEASKNLETRIMKFNTVTHGTHIFKTERWTEDVIIGWIEQTIDKP